MEGNSNKIVARGRVVSIRKAASGNMILSLYTQSGKDVYPRFIFKEMPELKPHANVVVEAHVESLVVSGDDGKRMIIQRFIGDSIRPSVSLTQEAFGEEAKGTFFPEPSFDMYIKGTVTGIHDDGDWLRVSIRLDDGRKKINTVRVSIKKLERAEHVKLNDVICAVCDITTPVKKDEDGKNVRYQNVVVSDYAILKHADNTGKTYSYTVETEPEVVNDEENIRETADVIESFF